MPYAMPTAAQIRANRTAWSLKKFIGLLVSQRSGPMACLRTFPDHKPRRGRLLHGARWGVGCRGVALRDRLLGRGAGGFYPGRVGQAHVCEELLEIAHGLRV